MPVRVAASVLVVEDDPEILRLMKQVLSRDFSVHTAASAEEGLQLLRAEKVHAVVSDQMLPAMNGIEFLKHVAALQPNAARVLVTASTRMDTAQDAINVARVKRFLAKPFRAAELLSTVGEAIHEVAVAQIKGELVRELKERNTELSRALGTLEARDADLSRKLEGLAFRDPVTGLFSHRYFQETLSLELQRAGVGRMAIALVMVDVDGFRTWNREYGFAEGDLLLRKVASAMTGAEATSRYGSNRFAALHPGATVEHAAAWAEKLRANLEREGKGRDMPGKFTVRAAVAAFPDHGNDEADLIDAAEAALAAAKREGGNRVAVAPPASAEGAS